MASVITLALVFLSGALYEAGCVAWVHFSERDQAGLTALWSMFNAAMQVFGMVEVVREPVMAAAFIGWYGAGSYISVLVKRRMKKARTSACTGWAASWCLVHGTCRCPRNDAGERIKEIDTCPLHGPASSHAEN